MIFSEIFDLMEINQVEIVSAERGALATFDAFLTAIGNTKLPFFIFPRVHCKTHVLLEPPEGRLC